MVKVGRQWLPTTRFPHNIKVKGRAAGAMPGVDLFYYSFSGGQCRDSRRRRTMLACVVC